MVMGRLWIQIGHATVAELGKEAGGGVREGSWQGVSGGVGDREAVGSGNRKYCLIFIVIFVLVLRLHWENT